MKGYCFIDMHIHSMFSNEEGVTQTPKNILDATLELIEDYKVNNRSKIAELLEKENVITEISEFFMLDNNEEIDFVRNVLKSPIDNEEKAKQILDKFAKACISIADHNSILGSVEAVKIINANPNIYKNIDFIPGIEFNAGLKNLRVNSQGKSVYSKCHMLGYGYDIEDENLLTFSKLFQLSLGEENINIGQAICAARNYLINSCGIAIPISKFKDLLELAIPLEKNANVSRSYALIRNKFLQICSNYLPKGFSLNKFNNLLIKTVFSDKPFKDKYNAGRGKLSVVETIQIIKNAGGTTSLAHPSMIKKDKQIYFKDPVAVQKIVSDIVELIQKRTNGGLDALEILHHDNTAVYHALHRVAKHYNLYVTAGSDCHNHNAALYNINSKGKPFISSCFSRKYNTSSLSFYSNRDAKEVDGFNMVIHLPIIGLITNEYSIENHQDLLIRDKKLTTYSWARLYEISGRCSNNKNNKKSSKGHKESFFDGELEKLMLEPEYEDKTNSNLNDYEKKWVKDEAWKLTLTNLKETYLEQERQANKDQAIKSSNGTELTD